MRLTLLLAAALQTERMQYCILLGVGAEEPTRRDGSLEALVARILDLAGGLAERARCPDPAGDSRLAALH